MAVSPLRITTDEEFKALASNRNYCFPCYNRWLPYSYKCHTLSLGGYVFSYKSSGFSVLIKNVDEQSRYISVCFANEFGTDINECIGMLLEFIKHQWGYQAVITYLDETDGLLPILKDCGFNVKAVLREHLFINNQYKNVVYLLWSSVNMKRL